MFTVYAVRHPVTNVVRHVGHTAGEPAEAIQRRNSFTPELRAWLDDLPTDPIVEVLERFDDQRRAWSRQQTWRYRLLRGGPALRESNPLPRDERVRAEPVRVAVPAVAVTTAIRLRTELVSYAEIAGRLTLLGQPPDHLWTPGEVRHVIASAFYA